MTALSVVLSLFSGCGGQSERSGTYEKVTTFAGIPKEGRGAVIKEPFGLAFDSKGNLYISDGEAGKIWQADKAGALKLVSDKLDTPSGLAFDKNDNLYVADPGAHTIKKVDITNGETSVIAGVENQPGFADGDAQNALFNAPVGIAVGESGKIFVADTYNDRIRVIENGNVSTLAGGGQGFADAESGPQAKFDTPCGIAVTKDESLLVADTGNKRLRLVENSGRVSTLAGGGGSENESSVVSLPALAGFAEPVDVKTDNRGVIYIADAAENTIYALGRSVFPVVEKLIAGRRGLADGTPGQAAFNRPTGLAIDANRSLFVADSENQLIRVLQNKEGSTGTEIKPEEIDALRPTAEEMRTSAPPRWPYDPPQRPREIAGTFGEIRGSIDTDEDIWFHNGLDIAGAYGETARFLRAEKVLRPLSTQLFNTLRENLRLPTLGYIHLRLGRDQNNKPFADSRFLFSYDQDGQSGKMSGVRIRRGTKFAAGEAIGTLNSMNHVHLIAGRSGNEMNALTALILPGLSDAIAPVIGKVALFDENWNPLGETQPGNERINVRGNVRVVANGYDRMDGNAERRRLGIYRLGYQVLRGDGSPAEGFGDNSTSLLFDKLPGNARLVYAAGSKSGATGETIFNYIVTNFAQGGDTREQFLDTGQLLEGDYILRVKAADFFGNEATKDVKIRVGR